ncbi:uncharacterized protein TNCV_2616281 [Trichonephila clavipes]|nr:uncharacterized protein TNCV_2616281 [Trichonephila clavipes]
MPESNAKRGKSFVKEKKEKLAASPVVKVTKNQKNRANSSSATAKSPTEYMREYRINGLPVPLTTEPSTYLVRVQTDACKSIINSILRYKDYDSHKNALEDFQKRFIDNPFGHGHSIYDRLWFRDDFRTPVAEHKNIL